MQVASVIILIFAAVYSLSAEDGIARFNTRNVRGYIRFTQLDNGTIEIRTNFMSLPLSSAFPYHVHNYPVDYRYDPTERCGAAYTGAHFDPTGRVVGSMGRYSEYCSQSNRTGCEEGDLSGKFGRLTNGTNTFWDDNLSISGRNGILYRSIVIHRVVGMTTPRYACATIEPTTSLASTITARAAFYGNLISGNIYFFQRSPSASSVQIFVSLSTVNTETDLTGLNWNVRQSAPGIRSRLGFCGNVGEFYNPRGREFTNCDSARQDICPEYALTEKHGSLSVTSGGNKFFFAESGSITLYGGNSIISRSLIIQDGSRIVACAVIGVVSPIRLRAVLSNGFEISATQYFPFSATRLSTSGSRTSLTRLELQDTGYISGVCNGSESRYNPFVNNAETTGERTPDSSRLGDLLEQIPSEGETSDASPFPLSGPFSAAERTIWYRIGTDSSCTNFEYNLDSRTDNAFVLRAYASFQSVGFTCMVHFAQLVTGTTYRPLSGRSPPNPNFQSGDVLVTDRCTNTTSRQYRFLTASDQQFYNPYNIMRQATDRTRYDADCIRQKQRRCTVGNNLLQTTSDTTRSYVNTNLELTGEFGVATSGIRVELNGIYSATVQASSQTSETYYVENCQQFNDRLQNGIDTCAGVEPNTFLPIMCSDSDINAENNTVSVTVDMVFAPGTNTQTAQECLLAIINSGNKLAAPIASILIVAILLLLV